MASASWMELTQRATESRVIMKQQSQQMTENVSLGARDDADMDLSSDEDGGVKLEVEDQSLPTSVAVEASVLQQEWDSLQSLTAPLWRLPMEPGPLSRQTMSQSQLVYHKCFELLRTNWHCSPGELIPVSLGNDTFYSLAMLLQIRMLSSHAKGVMDQVHASLVDQHRQRVSEMLPGSPVLTKVFGGNPASLAFCEAEIVENSLGLTLEDVSVVALQIHGTKRGRRGGRLVVDYSGVERGPPAGRLTKKQRQKAAHQQTTKDENEEEHAAVSCEMLDPGTQTRATMPSYHTDQPHTRLPQDTVDETSAAIQITSAERLRNLLKVNATKRCSGSVQYRPVGDDAGASPKASADLDSDEYSKISKQEKRDFIRLSHDINKHLGIKSLDATGKTRTRRRKPLREARLGVRQFSGSGLGTLPSERTSLNSLSSLHSRIGGDKEREIMESFQSLGLEH